MSVRLYDRRRAWASRARSVALGLLGVLVLLITAADALVTALLGIPPITPKVRELGRVIADEYRCAAMGAVDADIDEKEEAARHG